MLTQDLSHARSYLARVVPWPEEGSEPAYINVHWTFAPKDLKYDKNGNPIYPWSGLACRSVKEATNAVEYALTNPGTRDIYACMSSQSTATERVSGKGHKWYAPVRSQANAVALKSLFLDIDFKGGDHGYDTQEEAVTSLGNFIKKLGLPTPSLLTLTGGGMHVYWTMDRALSRAEWTPLAYALAEATKREGLKNDTQCIIDSCRVLRIPNTFNYKSEPKRPVVMPGTPNDFDYTVERIARCLEPYKVATPSVTQASRVDPTIFPPKAAIIGNNAMASGVDTGRRAPVDIKTVIPECAFIRNALATGGQLYTNPLWNLTTLLATFTTDGESLAHLMGRKHIGYSVSSTADLYARKVREKEERDLGWPSCATISAQGCKDCASCPHFKENKSPLNFASHFVPPTQNPITPPAVAGLVIDDTDLPSGYTRRHDGIICKLQTAEDGTTIQLPICNDVMVEAWLQKNPWELHFITVTDNRQPITIPTSLVGAMEMRRHLQEQGLMLHTDEVKPVSEFFVNWIDTLKTHKQAVVSTSPFGWNVKNGRVEGFVFGGAVWTGNGTRPAPSPDPVTANHYTPQGDIQPWMDAAKLITSQGRPALDAILASAFAAPLVRCTGQTGLQMSMYSEESGIGKTTTMKVAQAVWGDPVRAMQGLVDTQNSVLNKIGELRSLPLYWDELKTEEDTKRFINLIFQLTLGKEKSRMTARVAQKQVGTWQTLLVSASNESLLDYVVGRTKMTTAGLYRVFEVVVPPPVGKQGQIAPADAQRMVAKLNDNYGQIGIKYAEFLGPNYSSIDNEVGQYLKELETETNAHADERFWTALVATICMGARLANRLNFTNINEEALKAFMLKTLADMREERRSQPVDMNISMNVSNVLAQYLNVMRSRHTITTNRIHISPGKPPPGSITMIGDTTRLEAIYVHVGRDDKLLRISSTAMSTWLSEKGYSRHQFTKALEDKFGVKPIRGRIGSGTPFAGATEYLLELNLAGTPLANFIDEV